MWTFKQKTGELLLDGKLIGRGYSGWDDGDGIPEPGEGKNDPSTQATRNVGPVPQGRWTFREPFFHRSAGPYVLRLFPEEATNTLGRSGFLIHGDSAKSPGTASHGCIVLSRALRMKMWESGDHLLEVVAGDEPLEAKEKIK